MAMTLMEKVNTSTTVKTIRTRDNDVTMTAITTMMRMMVMTTDDCSNSKAMSADK